MKAAARLYSSAANDGKQDNSIAGLENPIRRADFFADDQQSVFLEGRFADSGKKALYLCAFRHQNLAGRFFTPHNAAFYGYRYHAAPPVMSAKSSGEKSKTDCESGLVSS